MTTPSPLRSLAGNWLAAAFLLLAAGIGALWYSAISAYEAAVLRERGRELQAIADLKIAFVRFWLEVKHGNATAPGRSELIARAAEFGLDRLGPSARSALMERLASIQTSYRFQSIMLLDRTGQVRAETGHRDENTRRHALATAREAMQAGKVRVSPAYETTSGGRPHLDIDIGAPVYAQERHSPRIVGALVFQLDPKVDLDPFLQRWPAPNESGESFLFARAGEAIVYLSSLRHADAAQLRRRADDPALPAALAARGGQGVVEGLDYRGVPVVAAVGQVPGMPWFVVSKLDRDEVLAPVRREALWSGALSSLLALALGLAMLAWHRRGQSELALAQQAAAKAALTASEARFRRLHEHGWDFNILFDRGRVMRYASPSIDRLLGGQAVGQEIVAGTARVHPDDVARVEAARQAALKQPGKPQFVAHRLAGEDGGWLSVEACFTNYLDDPDIAALAYTARDVSDRLEAERRQRESEAHYRLLFKLSPDAVFVHRNNIILYANDAAARLFGADAASALIGQDWHALIAPEDWPKTELRVAALMDGRQGFLPPSETHYRALDGRTIPVEAKGARIDLDGEAAIMSVVRDISERKLAEAKLKQSEARLRAIFECAPVGIAIADAEGRYTMVNPAQCRMLGYGEEELIGRSFAEFTHREEAQANLDLTALVRSGTADMASLEKRYVRKDGSLLWVLLTVGRISGTDGGPIGTVGIAQDITERREAEAQRLEHLRLQRDTLVREVHHRIKNHLQGLAGLLRRQMAPHAELAPLLDDVIAQIGAIAIVHGLQGRTPTGQASLRGLVEEIGAFLRGIAGIPIEWSQEGQQCFRETTCAGRQDCQWAVVEEESVSLALVINELLTNALRHGTVGGPVTLEVGCDGQGARIVIRNPGRLADGVDLAHGSGLGTGLTLVRSLLPQCGLSIRLADTGNGVETQVDIAPPVLARMAQPQVASLR